MPAIRLVAPDGEEHSSLHMREGTHSVDSERLQAVVGTWRLTVSTRAATGRFHATCKAR